MIGSRKSILRVNNKKSAANCVESSEDSDVEVEWSQTASSAECVPSTSVSIFNDCFSFLPFD